MQQVALTLPELENMASEILEKHSFSFDSFNEAKETISFRGGKYSFDRLSLCTYSHNLTAEDYYKLGKLLGSRYVKYFGREARKTRKEYAVLFHLVRTTGQYADLKITKKARPDFVLSGHETIGVEVTELTTPTTEVLATIARQNFGRGLTAEKIHKQAKDRHGGKADSYGYFDLDGVVAVGTELFDVLERHQQYADEVIRKYDLYNEMFPLYDSFIVLCNGQNSICLTTEEDSKEIFMLAKNKRPDMYGFILDILRMDETGTCVLDSFEV